MGRKAINDETARNIRTGTVAMYPNKSGRTYWTIMKNSEPRKKPIRRKSARPNLEVIC